MFIFFLIIMVALIVYLMIIQRGMIKTMKQVYKLNAEIRQLNLDINDEVIKKLKNNHDN